MVENVVRIDSFKEGPLFTGQVRRKLEDSIREKTEKPGEVVSTIEQLLCTQIVTSLRGVVTALFAKGGRAVAKALVG